MAVYLLSSDKSLLRNLKKEAGTHIEPLDSGNLVAPVPKADVVLIDSVATAHNGLDVACKLSARQVRTVLLLREPSLALTLAARACGVSATLAVPVTAASLQELLQPSAALLMTWRGAALSTGTQTYVGSSNALHECFQASSAASASELPVLIVGESGVGKSLLARIIHQHGPRAGGAFVTVSCNAMDETLLAAELFGRDAQLGSGPVTGQIARAAAGTLVLDDVDELSDTLGRQLGRVLDEREFAALGAFETQPVTSRVIATATETPAILAHHFSMRIQVPPLRTHPEDVALLAAFFMEQLSGERKLQLDAEALSSLQAYEWPGNIRQLKHVIERAAAVAESDVIGRRHLPAELLGLSERMPGIDTSETALATVERRHIREVWRMTGGHISDTADLLGIHRNTLRRKLEEYGILD